MRRMSTLAAANIAAAIAGALAPPVLDEAVPTRTQRPRKTTKQLKWRRSGRDGHRRWGRKLNGVV